MSQGRLFGTETEYAIRFSPTQEGAARPGNERLFLAIREAVARRVHTRPGGGVLDRLRTRIFTENGGSLYYEFVPDAYQGGLVEAATPECRSPAQLVRYQRAQDRLLAEAVDEAQRDLAEQGVHGELALLKNCRDAFGNVYGAQESYEATLAHGPRLWLWWATLALALPFAAVVVAVYWLLLVTVGTVTIAWLAIYMARLVLRGIEPDEDPGWVGMLNRLGRFEYVLDFVLAGPMSLIVAAGLRLSAFRPYVRDATAFLVSRCLFSGAGTLLPDGSFALSEKALAIRRMSRWTPLPADRGLLETGHLIKPLFGLVWLDWRGVLSLLRPRQRLQLGLSDANLCDVAELLKVGTTALVLDMVEAGALDDAPRLRDPIAALHTIASDPGLTVEVPLADGSAMTGLALQRFYQERAKTWLAEQEAVPLESHELVQRWGQVLDQLEGHRSALVGRLDWVTKEALLASTADLPYEARKKIDLRYHELGTGYHAMLEAEGLVPRLLDDDDIARARHEPPDNSPAFDRGRLVRALSLEGTDAQVSWDEVRVGGPKGRVIPLDRFRNRSSDRG